MASDISPVRQFQTDPAAAWTFKTRLGAIVPLPTGTTFTLYLYDPSVNRAKIGAGTWTSTPGGLAAGQATYAWNVADTTVTGKFKVYAGYLTPTGGQGYTDPEEFEVDPIFIQQ